MKTSGRYVAMLSILFTCICSSAWAIPTLQIGAPAGAGDSGLYADYTKQLTDPTESDTAVTSGSTIYVMGQYKNPVPDPLVKGTYDLLLGGKYSGPQVFPDMNEAENWGNFGFDQRFNTAGAVLMATVADGSLGTAGTSLQLTMGGQTINPFYSTSVFKQGFVMPNRPSNHAPVQNQDYLFFNIGNFNTITGAVTNMADETGTATGERKEISIQATGFGWIHFDVFALVTELEVDAVGCKKSTARLVSSIDDTDLVGNPGSHDVTWKQSQVVPEPGTFILTGLGLAAFGLYRRNRRS